jgi:uncharacterized protein YegL
MEEHKIQGSAYGFSATRVENLGASEYTLVGIAADVSGSVVGFKAEIEKCLKEVVKSCQRSPRADNLMQRMSIFDENVDEVHGFKLLSECNPSDYDGVIQTGGMTALFDAAVNQIEAITRYGMDLTKSDFDVNGILFVITDGDDNRSSMTAQEVKKRLEAAVQSEALESMVSVLIGVNITEPRIQRFLADFHKEAGFTQYIELDNAEAKTLAKLAKFVSQSISSQSQALGTGGPSQSISF